MSTSGVNVRFPYLDPSETQPDYESFFSFSNEIKSQLMSQLLEDKKLYILREVASQRKTFEDPNGNSQDGIKGLIRQLELLSLINDLIGKNERSELEDKIFHLEQKNSDLTIQYHSLARDKAQQEYDHAKILLQNTQDNLRNTCSML